MRKKLLSILLTLALLLSLIPAGYAADIEIVDEPVGADAPGGSLDEIVIDPVGADALGGPLADGNIVASGKCGDDLTWTLDEQGTLTISGTGDMWDYNWNTTPWYGYRSSIMTLVIEEGVTSISKFAFLYCGSLTNVMLPESMISIGWRAFESCTALTRVTIPAGVTNIEDSVFMNCSSLEAIIVAEGNQYYQSLDGVLLTKDGSALICCPARKTGEYEVPAGVETIENWAFDECSGLTAITLPDSLRHINWGAFSGCTGISEITLPEGLLSVDSDSFANMNLHEITFPASLQEFRSGSGDAVFANTPIENIYVAEDNPTFCSVDGVMFSKDQSELVMFPTGRTGSYTAPEGVTSLGRKAFDGVLLDEVILPESLTEIGPNAFQFAWDLTSLTIPASVTTIGTWAFAYCSLTEIRFEGSAPSFGEGVFFGLSATAYYPENDPSWTEDVMQNYNGTITWVPYTPEEPEPTIIASGECGESLTWTLDDQGTLTITGTGDMWDYSSGNKAGWYSYRDSIVTVVIEEGATSIGAYAFNMCTVMTSITIPEGVTSIGVYAFSDCSSLTSITIPEGVTSLGNGVFRACGRLTSVTIPGSVTSIGDYAFGINSSLIDIFVAEDNPCYQSIDGVLFDKDGTHLLVFPGGRSGAYTIPDGVESIDGFSWCTRLTSVTVPASVTNVESGTFTQCSGLKTIYFEGPAPKFGSYSFSAVTATAYYPENDPSWTEDVRQNYGGTITWEPYTPEPDLNEITEDYTRGTASVSYVETLGSGETVFTVSSEGDRPVLVAVKNGDEYTVIPCTTDENGVHRYMAELGPDSELVIAFKGDVNLDGAVKSSEVTMIKRAIAGTYQFKNGMAELAADVSGDGTIKSSDATMLARSIAGTYTIKW
ncbi:MAG: leucine-rich repeat protein [Oscillospiraceae bacterium]|nr:leucine-rich repeat protein [Oscillospiraceae bacterium]MBR0311857.1 leucine-rich repeat protein [Oscillospiraceae bacterium]